MLFFCNFEFYFLETFIFFVYFKLANSSLLSRLKNRIEYNPCTVYIFPEDAYDDAYDALGKHVCSLGDISVEQSTDPASVHYDTEDLVSASYRVTSADDINYRELTTWPTKTTAKEYYDYEEAWPKAPPSWQLQTSAHPKPTTTRKKTFPSYFPKYKTTVDDGIALKWIEYIKNATIDAVAIMRSGTRTSDQWVYATKDYDAKKYTYADSKFHYPDKFNKRLLSLLRLHSTYSAFVRWRPGFPVLTRYYGTTKILSYFTYSKVYKNNHLYEYARLADYKIFTQMTPTSPSITTPSSPFRPTTTTSTTTRPTTTTSTTTRPTTTTSTTTRPTTTTSITTTSATTTSTTITSTIQTKSSTTKTSLTRSRKKTTTKKYMKPPSHRCRTKKKPKPPKPRNWSPCYLCGLNETEIPLTSQCYDVFEAGDMRYSHLQRLYKLRCYYSDQAGEDSGKKVVYGPSYIGGCFKRFLDVGVVYNERGCRSWPPLKGKSFASRKLAKLERVLEGATDRCVVSPFASLTPFARGISLYVRYHVCVCSGKYCNDASKLDSTTALTSIVFLGVLGKVLLSGSR